MSADREPVGRGAGEDPLRVVALVAAHNEADVIAATLEDLLSQGIGVRLLDDASTDDTVARAREVATRIEGAAELLEIEHLEAPADGRRRWADILRWKTERANEIEADWFLSHDADELRESPWRHLSLRQAIELVDAEGYDAIDFEVLDFWPTERGPDVERGEPAYRSADELRAAYRYFEYSPEFNALQVKAWRRPEDGDVDLLASGGHEVLFRGRRLFPVRFLLRHYPVRSAVHGERKIEHERRSRLAEEERELGWHVQYDAWSRWQRDSRELESYDPDRVRLRLFLTATGRGDGRVESSVEADSLRRQMSKLEGDLDARSKEIRKLHDRLDASQRDLRSSRSELAERDAEMERLHRRLDQANRLGEDANAELDRRNRELAGLHERLDEREKRLEHAERRLDDALRTLETRTEKLKGLEQQVAGTARELERVEADLDRRNREAEDLHERLRRRELRLLELQPRLDRALQDLESLRHEMGLAKEASTSLEKQVIDAELHRRQADAAVEAAKARLDEVLGSRIWRWTAPLRRLPGSHPRRSSEDGS